MGVIPISLGLGWVRRQIGDLQLQADDWLPTQCKQGCRPIRIPGGSDPTHSKTGTPVPASPFLLPLPVHAACPHSLNLSSHPGSPESPHTLVQASDSRESRLGVRGPLFLAPAPAPTDLGQEI